MRNIAARSISIAFGITVPVLAIAGCPNPFVSTNPSPSPSTSTSPSVAPSTTPTPASSTAPRVPVAFSQLYFGTATDGSQHTVTLANLKGSAVDVTNYVVGYQPGNSSNLNYFSLGGTSLPTTGITLANVATGSASGTWYPLGLVNLSATSADHMGIQAGAGGAIALFQGVTTSADLKAANMLDYVQYGAPTNAPSLASMAVSAGIWPSATTFVTGVAAGKTLKATTAGATGSTNWTVQ